MADHDFIDDGTDDDDVEVRFVQPYDATKPYRCPGCDHDVPVGMHHVVVIPRRSPDDRRHWHKGCWDRAARGGRGPVRPKRHR